MAHASITSGKRVLIRISKTFLRTPLEGVRDVKIIQRKNRARIGREPFDLAVLHRHGKTPSRYPWSRTSGSIMKRVKQLTCESVEVTSHECTASTLQRSIASTLSLQFALTFLNSHLKALSCSPCIASAGGCADPLEKRIAQEAGKIQARHHRAGNSRPDRSLPDDPTNRPSVPQTHP